MKPLENEFVYMDHNLPYFDPDFKFKWPAIDESLHGDISTLAHVDQFVMPHIPEDRRRCVVQAGGAVGVWPKRFAQLFETVYTFEPTPMSFACLEANCPEKNIFRYNAAVGDRCDRGVTMGYPEHVGSNTGRENIGGYRVLDDGDVPMVTLDTAIPFEEPVDLLYLDVEGYELFALHGAKGLIQRCKPYIVLEDKASCTRWFNYQVGDCEKFLKPLGYMTRNRWQGGRDVMLEPV